VSRSDHSETSILIEIYGGRHVTGTIFAIGETMEQLLEQDRGAVPST
jgi:hypothetical protein